MPLTLLLRHHFLSQPTPVASRGIPWQADGGVEVALHRMLALPKRGQLQPTAPLFGRAMTENLPSGSTLSKERDCLLSLGGEMAIGVNLH